MKGVVLAGGLGTRLDPLTRLINKHMLPVYDRPMIHFPIESLVGAGIEEILVVTGRDHVDAFRAALGHGPALGAREIVFACQEGEGGIADALRVAEDFAAGERTCVILGDNVTNADLRPSIAAFARQPSGARVLLKQVPDPERFGVARVEDGRVVEIVEKPARPAGRLAVTGIYLYDDDVFSICAGLAPSARGELEITDVNNAYLRRGDLAFDMLDGWWSDAGTFESLHRAARLVAAERARSITAERTAAWTFPSENKARAA